MHSSIPILTAHKASSDTKLMNYTILLLLLLKYRFNIYNHSYILQFSAQIRQLLLCGISQGGKLSRARVQMYQTLVCRCRITCEQDWHPNLWVLSLNHGNMFAIPPLTDNMIRFPKYDIQF